jgi:hypothetical protein
MTLPVQLSLTDSSATNREVRLRIVQESLLLQSVISYANTSGLAFVHLRSCSLKIFSMLASLEDLTRLLAQLIVRQTA